LDSLAKSSVHFDERMGLNQKKLLRPKRPGFQFVEEGKLTRQAELQKIKVCGTCKICFGYVYQYFFSLI
jgi:U4/U6 small nuclear ribonucleoprotein PRP3